MSVFEKMSQEKIRASQEKLKLLCKKHGIEEFNIDEKDGIACWRKLIHAMCGIDIHHKEKSGRKANSDELIDDVRRLYTLHTSFSRFRTRKDQKTGKEIICGDAPAFSDREIHQLIADNLSKKHGKKITPTRIRGILNNRHNANQLDRLKRAEIENLENDPSDPDEIFDNMYK